MKRLDPPSLLGMLLLTVVLGCASDDGGTAATEGPPASTSNTSTSDTGTSTQGDDSTTASSTETGTSPTMSCEDATTPEECEAVTQTTFTCGWLLTRRWAIGEDGTCQDLGMEGGRCVTTYEDSGCGDHPATCPDGSTAVFYDPADVGGEGLELLVAPMIGCNGPSGWTACGFDEDGAGGSDSGTTGTGTGTGSTGDGGPTWDPAVCECACPA